MSNAVLHCAAWGATNGALQLRQRGRCCASAAESSSAEERVFACDLPEPCREDTVYACPLPEPQRRPFWQFWRRAQPPVRVEPRLESAEEELRLRLSRTRWEEQQARLQTVAECFRTADLAKTCGDFETAARLRDYASQLAGQLGEQQEGVAFTKPPSRDVSVDIRQLAGGMREVWASVEVAAPAEVVWRTLTDYERLAGTFAFMHVSPESTLTRCFCRYCALFGGKQSGGALDGRCEASPGTAPLT